MAAGEECENIWKMAYGRETAKKRHQPARSPISIVPRCWRRNTRTRLPRLARHRLRSSRTWRGGYLGADNENGAGDIALFAATTGWLQRSPHRLPAALAASPKKKKAAKTTSGAAKIVAYESSIFEIPKRRRSLMAARRRLAKQTSVNRANGRRHPAAKSNGGEKLISA
jgi:hypothetical protein